MSCDGHYGTVRYCGPVVGTKGTWIGVEWEDPIRGKHNGCHGGVQYFHTSAETGGSFIRPQKVDQRMSIPEAICSKYFSSLGNVCTEGNRDVVLVKSSIGRVVELVGFEKVISKQSQGWNLVNVVLADMPIDSPGEEGELLALTPNILSLDLSHTLLSSWDQVAQAAKQLHHLRSLVLSKNSLAVPKKPADFRDAFKSLKELVLLQVGYSCDEVLLCAAMWPQVEMLVLSYNNISLLHLPPDLGPVFQELQELTLDGNPISSWEEVCHLGRLPRLRTLNMADCDLASISFPDTEPEEKTPLFENLVSLNLHNNRLEEWSSIAELNKLRGLRSLIVKGNSVVVKELRGVSRFLVIAHVGGLRELDRIEISKVEKREAALYYVNRFYPLWLQHGGTAEGGSPSRDFVRQHPTFMQLLKAYGAPDVPDSKKPARNLKSKFVNIEIVAPQEPERAPVKKALPGSVTVVKLRCLAMHLFSKNNQQSRNMKLTLIRPERNIEEEFDSGLQKDLSFYSVTDGCKIYVRW